MITVKSFLLDGLTAVPVNVECDIFPGIGVHILGLPDEELCKSLLRVATALDALGYHLPGKKIIVNVLPKPTPSSRAETLDLPMALAILAASGQETMTRLGDTVFAGELALDGTVRRVPGGFSAGRMAGDAPGTRLALPEGTAGDALSATGREGMVYRVATLRDAVTVACGGEGLPEERQPRDAWAPGRDTREDVPAITKAALRKLEIAAAGGFDIIVTGGSEDGRRAAAGAYAALADPVLDDVTKAACSAHCLQRPACAPFRAVPRTTSSPALCGGGPYCSPGMMTLCHGGTLLAEDASRWPYPLAGIVCSTHRSGKVTLRRLDGTTEYPARFRLALSDEAGNLAAALDRFPDIRFLHVSLDGDGEPVTKKDWQAARLRVNNALLRQREERDDNVRYAGIPTRDMAIPLDGAAGRLMVRLIDALGISASRYAHVVRMAASAAALDCKDAPDLDSLCEAASLVPRKAAEDAA